MASQAYEDWLAAGKPWNLARPCADLQRNLMRHGYTVYAYPDDRHLEADTPEDHTSFSATGWPKSSPRWWGHALDIMPPASGKKSPITGKPLPSLQRLGAQILKDRKAGIAGIAWLKYMNWEPERNNGGPCYQERWMPAYARRTSSDRGHIHLSARSDKTHSTQGATYDPVLRIQGVLLTDAQYENIMKRLDVIAADASAARQNSDAASRRVQGVLLGKDVKTSWSGKNPEDVEVNALRNQINTLSEEPRTVTLDPTQMAQLTADVSAAVINALKSGAFTFEELETS